MIWHQRTWLCLRPATPNYRRTSRRARPSSPDAAVPTVTARRGPQARRRFATPNRLFSNADMPRYPLSEDLALHRHGAAHVVHEERYPHRFMVSHHSFVGTRTVTMWTGAEDRLHDCRARNEVEAIMWHCYSKNSHAYQSALNFYKASKTHRDAVVKFLQSIVNSASYIS